MKYIAAIILALLAASAAAQNIYKTVDEDGNVVYTDAPPTEGAKPMDLPPITVADPYEVPVAADTPDGEKDAVTTVYYPDLSFVSPISEEHFWGTGGSFTAQLASSQTLAGDHQVRFSLDGQEAGTTSSFFMQFNGIDRGEHTVSAEILDAGGKVLARAAPVTFYMRQQSVLRNGNARNSNGRP